MNNPRITIPKWQLMAIDRWLIRIFVVSLVILGGCAYFKGETNNNDTIYRSGYYQGFQEHGVVLYNFYNSFTAQHNSFYTTENYTFACGYMSGYSDWMNTTKRTQA